MKHLLIGTLLFWSVKALAAPDIEWIETTHDFGAFYESVGTVSCVFEGINRGETSAAVLSVRANCGCTAAELSSDVVQPGDTLRIKATYNPANRPGPFDKTVYVQFAGLPRQELMITGRVVGDNPILKRSYTNDCGCFRIGESSLNFGFVTLNRKADGTIKAVNYSVDSITPVLIQPASESFSLRVEPATVAPGQNFTLGYTVDAAKLGGYGLQSDTIWIGAKELPDKRCRLTVTAIVTDDFSKMTDEQIERAPMIVSRSSVDFGRIDTTSTKPIHAEMVLVNNGHETGHIHRIYTLDRNIQIKGFKEGMTLKPGKELHLTIETNPQQLRNSEMLNAKVAVVSDSPISPVVNVSVFGRLHNGDESSNDKK